MEVNKKYPAIVPKEAARSLRKRTKLYFNSEQVLNGAWCNYEKYPRYFSMVVELFAEREEEMEEQYQALGG